MLQNSWSNKLTQEPKMATIVKIPNSTIIYQNQANQLIAHSQTQTSPLPIRKDILSLGCFPTGQILLLSRYQLLCFDLLNNNELFSLQFQNANKLFVSNDEIFVVCGGDLFCYNFQGEEKYVNHCSANIQSLTTVMIKQTSQVVIGFNDVTMTRYKGVNISFDYGKIFGVASSIDSIGQSVIVGSQEGTVGFYESKKSKWKAKSTHPVFKVIAHRTESDYLAIIIRNDGILQLKDWKGKGETIHKLKISEQVIGAFINDFRSEDNQQLICITKQGNIKGYNLYEQAKKIEKKKVADQVKLQFQNMEVLQAEKLQLQFQIRQLRQIIAKGKQNKQENVQSQEILTKDFNFQTYLHHEDQGLVLEVNSYNGYISGLMFEEPIMPVIYDRLQNIKYLFKAENIIFGQITCILLVHSNYTSKVYETKMFKITLPKFWKLAEVQKDKAKNKINGGIKFALVQRNARYIKWIHQCFFMKWSEEQRSKLQSNNPLKLRFYNAYDKIDLQFIFLQKEGRVQIWSQCLKTLGQVFQDLIQYVGIKQLNSELFFNKQKQKLKDTLNMIQKLTQAKVSISSQMAQAIDNIKFLLVKGQSARCVGSMKDLRKTYSQIMGFNKNLLAQISKKNANTKQLSQSLKILGQFINQAANVRYGKAKQSLITACRECIKKKQFPNIISIMQRGQSAL